MKTFASPIELRRELAALDYSPVTIVQDDNVSMQKTIYLFII